MDEATRAIWQSLFWIRLATLLAVTAEYRCVVTPTLTCDTAGTMRASILALVLVGTMSAGLSVVACSSARAVGAGDGSDGGSSGTTSGGTSGTSGGTSGTSGGSGGSGGTSGGTGGTSGGLDGGADGAGADGGDGGPVGTPAVQLIGRFDTSDPAGPRFAWPGTRIIANFDGTAVSVKLTQTPGFEAALPTYFDVVVDGVLGTPFTVSGTQTVVLASGKTAGPHTVEIMKRTEANFGTVRFEGFTFTGGAGLLAPPAPLARKIEFLGDSTIDGYGIEGNFSTTCAGGAPPQFDEARKSVSWLSAAGLGAELHLLGYSGKGLARNEGGSTVDTFPVIYTRTLPDVAGSTWPFSSWVPDAVVIAMGGADYSGDPNGTFPATFRATYQTLLADIRTRYGASTYVFLTVWSQYKAYDGVRQEITAAIDQAIGSRPAGEKNYKLVLPEADFASDETGCQLHGNETHHAAMAVKVIKGIKDVTLWP
jgi:lysophospholipase L1-like esterase